MLLRWYLGSKDGKGRKGELCCSWAQRQAEKIATFHFCIESFANCRNDAVLLGGVLRFDIFFKLIRITTLD